MPDTIKLLPNAELTETPKPYRFTATEYFKLDEIGIFPEDNRTELLEGEIFQKYPEPAPLRFTVDAFYKAVESGIFDSVGNRVELIEGEIIQMATIGTRHAGTVNRLNATLIQLLGTSVVVSIQNPLEVTPRNSPMPDVIVLKPRADFYSTAHPAPADVLLLIEVCDTTLAEDRKTKLPMYARAAVPEVWLVNLPDATVEVYTQPDNGVYQTKRTFQRGETLTAAQVPNLTLSVDSILS